LPITAIPDKIDSSIKQHYWQLNDYFMGREFFMSMMITEILQLSKKFNCQFIGTTLGYLFNGIGNKLNVYGKIYYQNPDFLNRNNPKCA